VRDHRSALAFVFGLVGGLAILVTIAMFYPLFLYGFAGPPFYGIFGLFLGIVAGAFVVLGAAMVFRRPEHGVLWGVVMVVFGALSGFGLAGFGIGMALAVAGGAIAIVVGSGTAPGAGGLRACVSCGMLFSSTFPHCPHCGAAVPVARPSP
jgi:hypothetical protein